MKRPLHALAAAMIGATVLGCPMQPAPEPQPQPTDFTEFVQDVLTDDENDEPRDIADDDEFVAEEDNTVFDNVLNP